ncbi:MAG: hypothetical protein K9L95_06485 [Candidatus Omnitrophica bacterium]|nr:hypothetical protein [Candidatus Omnitrophota bacterium]
MKVNRKSIIFKYLFLAFFLPVFYLNAEAAVIYTDNGQRFEGPIVEKTEEIIKIKLIKFDNKIISIPAGKVKRIVGEGLPDKNSTVGSKVKIDGKIGDWKNIPPLINEEKQDVPNTTEVTHDNSKGRYKVDHYNYDVTGLRMTADENYVYLLVELAKDVQYYLTKHKEADDLGDNIGYLYLDLDKDRYTGNLKEPGVWNKQHPGFEVEIAINEGYTTEVSDSEFISYAIRFYNKESESFVYDIDKYGFNYFSIKTTGNPSEIAFGENFIEMRIPQKFLDIKKGQTVRAVFYEWADSTDSYSGQRPWSEYSEEVTKEIW